LDIPDVSSTEIKKNDHKNYLDLIKQNRHGFDQGGSKGFLFDLSSGADVFGYQDKNNGFFRFSEVF